MQGAESLAFRAGMPNLADLCHGGAHPLELGDAGDRLHDRPHHARADHGDRDQGAGRHVAAEHEMHTDENDGDGHHLLKYAVDLTGGDGDPFLALMGADGGARRTPPFAPLAGFLRQRLDRVDAADGIAQHEIPAALVAAGAARHAALQEAEGERRAAHHRGETDHQQAQGDAVSDQNRQEYQEGTQIEDAAQHLAHEEIADRGDALDAALQGIAFAAEKVVHRQIEHFVEGVAGKPRFDGAGDEADDIGAGESQHAAEHKRQYDADGEHEERRGCLVADHLVERGLQEDDRREGEGMEDQGYPERQRQQPFEAGDFRYEPAPVERPVLRLLAGDACHQGDAAVPHLAEIVEFHIDRAGRGVGRVEGDQLGGLTAVLRLVMTQARKHQGAAIAQQRHGGKEIIALFEVAQANRAELDRDAELVEEGRDRLETGKLAGLVRAFDAVGSQLDTELPGDQGGAKPDLQECCSSRHSALPVPFRTIPPPGDGRSCSVN